MPPRLSASARREQLLTVARDVFARHGYHNSSMNEVADAAGVTKPVLYQHFDSKRDLYLALLEDVGNQLITQIAKAAGEATDGKSQTERGFQAYFRWVHEDRGAFMLLFGSGNRRDEDFAVTVRKVVDASAEAIAPLIAVDIDTEHQRTIAHGLVGLAEGVSRRLVDDDIAFDPDIVAQQVADLAWAGLRGVRRVGEPPTPLAD
jgi:AcrR family transcriptional regulator